METDYKRHKLMIQYANFSQMGNDRSFDQMCNTAHTINKNTWKMN